MATGFFQKYLKNALVRGRFAVLVVLAIFLSGTAFSAPPDFLQVAIGYIGYEGDTSAANLNCEKQLLNTASLPMNVDGAQLTYSVYCIINVGQPQVAIGPARDSPKESIPQLIPDLQSPVRIPIDQKGFGKKTVNVELRPAQSGSNDLVIRHIIPPLGLLYIRVSPSNDRH